MDVGAAGKPVWLDLGAVREIAEVRINGKRAGVRWKKPYRLEIARLVKPGKNVVEVGVTNLRINRVLGLPDPDYSGLPKPLRFPLPEERKRIGEPLPSGLLGPVRVLSY